MSKYGVRVFNTAGNIRLDLTDRVGSLIYIDKKHANLNGIIYISQMDGRETIQFGLAINQPSSCFPHRIRRVANTVPWDQEPGQQIYGTRVMIFAIT